ncbi:hypothetical protein VP01_6110g1 [Puccinia sorghi]|uniref:Uncharacterized protein n=1 Tax=Puccinia sorghi TaxID=27349 RepID=A0A0L6UGZ9_9BASI|nr:hypothetical protein VP01_6110g1 [Puccinia sorghi]
MDVRMFEENTGEGIENNSGPQALYNLLVTKSNDTFLFEFDHSRS